MKTWITYIFAIFIILNISMISSTDSKSLEDQSYFPPPESQGGWCKLTDPEEIKKRAGMDPVKLSQLEQWLLNSDNRPFAAVVIRNGYIVLEEERGNSSKTDSRRVASVSKAICATVLAIASERSQLGQTPRKMTFDDPAFDFIPWAFPLSDSRKAQITVKQLLNHTSGICPEATGAPNNGSWNTFLVLAVMNVPPSWHLIRGRDVATRLMLSLMPHWYVRQLPVNRMMNLRLKRCLNRLASSIGGSNISTVVKTSGGIHHMDSVCQHETWRVLHIVCCKMDAGENNKSFRNGLLKKRLILHIMSKARN